jgi:cell division protein FtsW
MLSKMGNGAVDNLKRRSSIFQLPSLQHRLIYLGIDLPLLLVSVVLVIFGLMMVYSASTDFSLLVYGSPNHIFVRQLEVLIAAVLIGLFLTFFDYHRWQKLALPAMLVTIVMLFAVLFLSDERHGAVRTLWQGSIQPSELAKLIIIIYLSVWLNNKRDYLADIKFGLLPLGGILGFVGGMIIIQPDVSAVLTILVIGGTMFFLAGGDTRQIAYMILMALFVGFLIVVFSNTGSRRLADFLPGLFDPLKAPYHVRRSLEAFYRGGWFGVGLGNADAKVTGLPVPHTDSIFAVVGEELGVLGSTILVGLYLVLLWRGLSIASRAKDYLGSLLASGLSLWLMMEALINMLVMVNLLPFAGNALPFISAGGSNLLVSLAAIGMLINISRMANDTKDVKQQTYASVVDLRGRDWRRRVSGARRSGSATRQFQDRP